MKNVKPSLPDGANIMRPDRTDQPASTENAEPKIPNHSPIPTSDKGANLMHSSYKDLDGQSARHGD